MGKALGLTSVDDTRHRLRVRKLWVRGEGEDEGVPGPRQGRYLHEGTNGWRGGWMEGRVDMGFDTRGEMG